MAGTQDDGVPPSEQAGAYSGPRAVDPEPKDTHENDPDYITRTRFLSGVAMAGGAVLTGAIAVPIVGFAVTDSVKGEEDHWVDIGPLSDFPKDKTQSLAVSAGGGMPDRRVFLRYRDGVLMAIWNRCAHLGCPVTYSEGGDNYSCPCHGGAYDTLGKVTAGPPPRPLDRFDVKVVAGKKDVGKRGQIAGTWDPTGAPADARVLVGKAFSIDEEQRPYRIHGPGEEVEGILKYLYPF